MFVPLHMVPYVRQGYWRWWRLPDPPGTKNTESIFDPFGSMYGGLFWYDDKIYKETKKAMKNGDKLEALNIKDKTYMMESLKDENSK